MSESHYDRRSVGQFVLVFCPFWSRWSDVTFVRVTITFFIFHVGRPLWRVDGSVICSALTQVQFQITLRPTVCRPVRLDAGPPYQILISFLELLRLVIYVTGVRATCRRLPIRCSKIYCLIPTITKPIIMAITIEKVASYSHHANRVSVPWNPSRFISLAPCSRHTQP
jgi:hypothetical protein